MLLAAFSEIQWILLSIRLMPKAKFKRKPILNKVLKAKKSFAVVAINPVANVFLTGQSFITQT
jgi:hypothetical protein